jgi:hypothetical protein
LLIKLGIENTIEVNAHMVAQIEGVIFLAINIAAALMLENNETVIFK